MKLLSRLPFLSKNATPTSIGASALVLIIFLTVLYVIATTPPEFIESPHSKEITMKIQNLAKEVKGDASKLKPADRDWLDTMSSGHGSSIIEHMYKTPRYK